MTLFMDLYPLIIYFMIIQQVNLALSNHLENVVISALRRLAVL